MSRQGSKNLQDLLKFAISQQTDGARACDVIEKDNKSFLENVINSMSANVNQEFIRAIQILESNLSSENEKCDALTSIRENIDNIDCANNFVRIDGADILIECIMCDSTHIQINAINVVAELSQNNPFCQKYFVDNGAINLLVLKLAKGDDKVTASALYALSALLRDFQPAFVELNKINGLKNILLCLDSECSRVVAKACVLISSMSSEFPTVRDEFVTMDAFEKLSKNLEIVNDFDTKTDVLLIAMAELIKSSRCDPNACLRRNTAEILKTIMDQNKNLPQCEEIVTHSKLILDYFEKAM